MLRLFVGKIKEVATIGIDSALGVGSFVKRSLPQAVEWAYGVDESAGRH